MSRITKLFLSLLTILAVLGLVNQAQNLIAKDPLARFARHAFDDIGIRLSDVTLKHYSKGKLTGSAHIDNINVRQGNQYLDFIGVKNGDFQTKEGRIKFATQNASFDGQSNQLSITSPSRVTAKDLDVTTPAFLFDQVSSTLTMSGEVKGTCMGGKIVAQNLVYYGETGKSKIQHVDWVGVPPKDAGSELLQQTDSKSNRTSWHISGQFEGDNDVANYTDARATDDEILIKAPHAQLDRHTDVLTATGKVYYFSDKANLVCDKAVIYRREKRAVLTGNVHMLVKPKDQEKLDVTEIPPYKPPIPAAVAEGRPSAPETAETQQQKDLDDEVRSSKTGRKYPAHVKADRIEYWYGKGNRHAIITGSPECYQEFPGDRWRRIDTFKALYDGEKDEMVLVSTEGQHDTRIVDSLGDDLRAKDFTVSTKEDDDRSKGDEVDGVMTTDDEDVANTKDKGKPAPATAPGPGAIPVPGKPAPTVPGQTTPTTPGPAPANPTPANGH
ncbi:MAG TPA: hypothetical protein VGL56_18500 [Fimbriimonadaceae bacterium]|jgi:lipopolysaccharide export system protein LptA